MTKLGVEVSMSTETPCITVDHSLQFCTAGGAGEEDSGGPGRHKRGSETEVKGLEDLFFPVRSLIESLGPPPQGMMKENQHQGELLPALALWKPLGAGLLMIARLSLFAETSCLSISAGCPPWVIFSIVKIKSQRLSHSLWPKPSLGAKNMSLWDAGWISRSNPSLEVGQLVKQLHWKLRCNH